MALLNDIRRYLELKREEQTQPKKIITWDQYRAWNILKTDKKDTKLYPVSNEVVYCPKCESPNSHHIGVEIFDHTEDNPHGDHFMFWCKQSYGWGYLTDENTVVEQPNDSFDHDCSKHHNRRGSIVIKCACEGCGTIFNLEINQHKGETMLGVRQ